MPEMQSPDPAATAAIPMMIEVPVSALDDPDLALGCECADPALQIAQWRQEVRAAGPEGA
jgi:hypothetical protein